MGFCTGQIERRIVILAHAFWEASRDIPRVDIFRSMKDVRDHRKVVETSVKRITEKLKTLRDECMRLEWILEDYKIELDSLKIYEETNGVVDTIAAIREEWAK
uniref:Uncharacterized protein n=1 Tax=Nelumbo nucifera TaxID=4432 RepID=A0A822YEE6_NELNU|nr:TPA_asm: hypothetical protein HUJ06_031339 [Nelumbo nucifera]